MRYCYPMPQVSWDSNYYIVKSIKKYPGMRPIGYSEFLTFFHDIRPGLNFVVWVQFAFHFVAVYVLLQAVKQFVKMNGLFYYILGVVLLLEPVALYNAINILSDSIFSSLTFLYIATLAFYIRKGNYLFFVAHLLVIYCCIETRHIALFYPFFSILALFLATRRSLWIQAVNALLLVGVFMGLQAINKKRNEKAYGVPVASAFSGWTQANNALYAVPRINIDARFISDPEIRELHTFFKSYQESGAFIVHGVGSGYMWEGKSPLHVYRQKAEDSINQHGIDEQNWFRSMYVVAPKFDRYGKYIQKNFPYEFLMSFIVPNISTLIEPHDGEMSDYYIHPVLDEVALQHYHLRNEDFVCRKQIYKDHINAINLQLYQIRLLLFAACVVCIFLFRKEFKGLLPVNLIVVFSGFIIVYYLLTLYASWFMPRYLLPVLPLLSVVILVTLKVLFEHRRKLGEVMNARYFKN